MKTMHTMLVMLAILTSHYAIAQTNKSKSDTTKFLDGRITLIFNDKDSTNKNDKDAKKMVLTTKKEKKRKAFETQWLTVDLGFTNYVDKTPYGINYFAMPDPTRATEFLAPLGTPTKNDFELRSGKSINVNFGIVRAQWDLYKHHVNLVTGITYDINSYSYKSPITWNEEGFRNGLSPREEFITRDTMSFKKNKLVTNYLQVPLMLKFETNPYKEKKNFTFAVGGYAGYLMRVHTKQIYKGSDQKIKEYEDYNITKFQYGTQAEVSYRDYTFYFKRSLTPLAEFGTEQYPYSFGIRLSGN